MYVAYKEDRLPSYQNAGDVLIIAFVSGSVKLSTLVPEYRLFSKLNFTLIKKELLYSGFSAFKGSISFFS